MIDRGFAPSIILTGQHPTLNLEAHGLGTLETWRLNEVGRSDPDEHVIAVARATAHVMHQRPDLLIVQGDTSSALGAALGGVAAGVPLAHVEAGLRTHDETQPWPEEGYRRRIDAEAELLFAPTEQAALNLSNETVAGAIHVTGNTGIDALIEVARTLPQKRERDAGAFRLLVTCHRRENWGLGIAGVAAALREIATTPGTSITIVQHPNPELAETTADLVQGVAGISLQDPCGHRELVAKMMNSDLLLSDSGGVQEEAPALGVPLLVLREKTERPEGLATGNMRLVGCNPDAIRTAVHELSSDPVALAAMSRPAFPYGDGRASQRIAAVIHEWIAERSHSKQRAG